MRSVRSSCSRANPSVPSSNEPLNTGFAARAKGRQRRKRFFLIIIPSFIWLCFEAIAFHYTEKFRKGNICNVELLIQISLFGKFHAKSIQREILVPNANIAGIRNKQITELLLIGKAHDVAAFNVSVDEEDIVGSSGVAHAGTCPDVICIGIIP